MRAESRTLRLTTCPADRPPHPSPASGAIDTRPRDGLSPNRPHCAAGIRIEPPPSVACATGRMPAETAAAAPPGGTPGGELEVPGVVAGTVKPGLGIRIQAELRARATAHEDEPGLFAARDVGGLVIGDKIL